MYIYTDSTVETDSGNVITLEDDEDEVYFFNPGEYTVILNDKKEEVKAESSTTDVKKTETKKTTLVDKIKNKIKNKMHISSAFS